MQRIERVLDHWDLLEAQSPVRAHGRRAPDHSKRLVHFVRHDSGPTQALIAIAGQAILWAEARDAARETGIDSDGAA